jgi:RND superfamily putative drug exporter
MSNAIIKFITGRKTKWLIVALGVAAMFAATPEAVKDFTSTDATAFLPHTAQSTQVVQREKELPSGQTISTIVVYSRDGAKLTATDFGKINSDRSDLEPLAVKNQVSPAIPSVNGQAAIVTIQLPTDPKPAVSVAKVRTIVHANNPDGLSANVSGEGGFIADETNAFSGLNNRLLYASITVVAIILLLTYRSPWLWLVPLFVVAMADQVASGIVNAMAQHGTIVLNGENSGILRVLVFGAGTDYALLIIARYREELHYFEDRYEAMRRALKQAAPAILASGITVTLALLSLMFSSLNSDASLGPVGAVGILTALAFNLIVLPAALLLFGRGLFWPRVPRVDAVDPTKKALFAHIGQAVKRSPILLSVLSLIILGLFMLGLTTFKLGLTQSQSFRVTPESVTGQNIISDHFGAGSSSPLIVITATSKTDQTVAALKQDKHVVAVLPGSSNEQWTALTVTTNDSPDSTADYATITRLRTNLGQIEGADAIVGGSSAIDLDTNNAANHDRALVVPIILAIVFAVLIILLRSLMAPVILIITVVISYLAALGVSNVIFVSVFHFPAVDAIVPLLGFVFLVALGVDYNIFLATRASEEAEKLGPNEGMVSALRVTGGVITSAGFVLAATFVVLSVLPLVILTELGILVAVGVLIDTLLVRSILVPSVAVAMGHWFWWPRTFSDYAGVVPQVNAGTTTGRARPRLRSTAKPRSK